MRYFCTYFDHRYLPQGLALHESLSRHCFDFTLWILCLDRQTHVALCTLKLPKVELIRLDELECDDESLRPAKANRSLLEYYFTCTPFLPLFILKNNPAVDLITYLDADLFFFSSIEPLFDEIENHSIAIIPHRFPPAFRKAERHGVFNVGWVTFRRDENGIACLQWWREQCLGSCSDKDDGPGFADQKYLDDWPAQFGGVIVLQHKGANLAPWNLANYRMSVRAGAIYADDEPLIFFHFHGLKPLNGYLYNTHLQHYGATADAVTVRRIYAPYIRKITSLVRELVSMNGTSGPAPLSRESAANSDRRFSFSTLKHLLKRHYLVVVNGRVL
jgi:hypothetical protein